MSVNSRSSYRNLLAFTIISGIFSLLLVLVLYVSRTSKTTLPHLAMLITLEVGVFIIILTTIIRIYIAEKQKDYVPQAIVYETCPEYFTKKLINGKEVCSNETIVTDPLTQKLSIMKVYPIDNGNRIFNLPATHSSTITNTTPVYDKFYINQIASDVKNVNDQCDVITKEVTNPKLSRLQNFDAIPWTNVRSQCEY
jgi:hypothetical protein